MDSLEIFRVYHRFIAHLRLLRASRIDEIDRAEMKIRNHEWRRAPNALHRSDRPLCAIGVADRFLVPLASFFPFAQAGMPQQAISAMHMNVVPACKRLR